MIRIRRLDDDASNRHDGRPEEYNSVHSPTSAPTENNASALSLTLCSPDEEGYYGETGGNGTISALLEYAYEIESTSPQNGISLKSKVEHAISSQLISSLFESCAFEPQRRLDGSTLGVTGFSALPEDTLNAEGCRQTPTNGNSCVSVIGKCTVYGSTQMDLEGVKTKAEESLMYAMANDQFIHQDETIVKVNFMPYAQSKSVQSQNVQSVSGGGFNKLYLAFVPLGVAVICFAALTIVMRRRNQLLQKYNNKRQTVTNEEHWENNAKWEPDSSHADSVRSEILPYFVSGGIADTSSEISSLDDADIFLERAVPRNGVGTQLYRIETDE